MFAFVSAFPKSLHCTDEAQQVETVLSAVLSIYIYTTSSDDSRVDGIMCAGSPSSSRLFLRVVRWRDG